MQNLIQYTDEELVSLYKSGSEKAFDELYSRYALKLKKLIYYYLGDSDEANDVFHDVFIRVIRHIENFNLQMTFSSWIFQIAVNCSKNYIKKKKRNEVLIEKEKFKLKDTISGSISPEEEIISEIDLAEFNHAIDNLQDKFRNVFILRFDQKLKYSEISNVLECSERTAKWRMRRAIENIAQYLKEKNVV